jgi:alcohol dehydrogenase YqhD (iron-dependent ADH family)
VGGGSVIDGVKFYSVNQGDPRFYRNVSWSKRMQFGTVLTLPATGSENELWSSGYNQSYKEKLAFGFSCSSFQLQTHCYSVLPKRQLQMV